MFLPPGEPAAGPWRVAQLAELVEVVVGAGGGPASGPRIVAVDGRSASGKSTLANRLSAAVPASAVVSTDDIAWHHSYFGWAELLATGVLQPCRRGEAVSYRPRAWQERGRAGAIEVPAGRELLIVEGVGAGRRELTDLLDAVVWVQSDFELAERRGLARDIAKGINGDEEETVSFWHEWMAEEVVFLAQQRPWERACVVVAGTSCSRIGPDQTLLAPPPGRW
jgi:energy-coupling factor transporter ATP-binding protein EcfA2